MKYREEVIYGNKNLLYNLFNSDSCISLIAKKKKINKCQICDL